MPILSDVGHADRNAWPRLALTYSLTNWQEHLRRQYLARAPEENKLGTLEEPVDWAALSLTDKVRPRYDPYTASVLCLRERLLGLYVIVRLHLRSSPCRS